MHTSVYYADYLNRALLSRFGSATKIYNFPSPPGEVRLRLSPALSRPGANLNDQNDWLLLDVPERPNEPNELKEAGDYPSDALHALISVSHRVGCLSAVNKGGSVGGAGAGAGAAGAGAGSR